MSNDQLLKLLRLSGERSSADGSGIRLCDEAADAIERLSAANLSLESRVSQQARTIAEVFQKVGDMERDAARYRWLRNSSFRYANVDLSTTRDGDNCVDFVPRFSIPEPVGMEYEDNEWTVTDIDSAIDAAIAKDKA